MTDGELPRALRVVLTPESGIWIARGVEIPYVASGQNAADAMRRFVRELCSDIDEGRYAVLELPSPAGVWNQLVDAVKENSARFAGMFTLECRKPPEFPYDMALFFQIDERPARRGGRSKRQAQQRYAHRRTLQVGRVDAVPTRPGAARVRPARRRRTVARRYAAIGSRSVPATRRAQRSGGSGFAK